MPTDIEHDPEGMGLLTHREKRAGKLQSFRTATRDAVRMLSGIKKGGETTAQAHWNATHASDAEHAQLIPEFGQQPHPEAFREVPGQGLNVGDVVGNSLVWAVGAAAVIAKLKKSEEDKDDR